jgi:hypothetical protein
MVRNIVRNAQAKEPPVRKIHLHLTAEKSLRADGKYIADDAHPYHEHRIYPGAAEMELVRLRVYPRQIQHGSNLAHSVIVRPHRDGTNKTAAPGPG